LHIRSTCFFISEGVFRSGLSLWHRACFPFAIAKVRHLPQLTKFTRKKNAFSAVFLPFCLQKWGYSCRNTGIFRRKAGDFSGGLPLLSLLLHAAGPKHEAMLCLLACCSVCVPDAPVPLPSNGCRLSAMTKKRPSPTLSCGEVGDGLWWVASTTAQF